MTASPRIDRKTYNRIHKMIDAAKSWRASGNQHDANQAAAALGRARALCAKLNIAESNFIWPDKPKPALHGTRADFIIIDDPWASQDIPIKTAADLVREAMRNRAKVDPMTDEIRAANREKIRRKTGEQLMKEVQAEQRRRAAVKRFRDALRRQGLAADDSSASFRYFAEAMAAAQKAAADKENKS